MHNLQTVSIEYFSWFRGWEACLPDKFLMGFLLYLVPVVKLYVCFLQVQNLEKERLEYEQNLSKLKRLSDQRWQDVVGLQAQLAEMESLKTQLQQ
jgi:hypothetical protein